jgi:hypothetical protein
MMGDLKPSIDDDYQKLSFWMQWGMPVNVTFPTTG